MDQRRCKNKGNDNMQCVRGGGTAQHLFRNLMDLVGNGAMGVFANLCEDVCSEHFGHDIGRNVAVTFVSSEHVVGGVFPSWSDFVKEANFITRRQNQSKK